MTDSDTETPAGPVESPPPGVRFEHRGRVLVATIDRPASLNALDSRLMHTLVDRLEANDGNPDVGCFLLLGSERAFAAGADIKELSGWTSRSMADDRVFSRWDDFAELRTPKIAAVSGYALGGGCELAMMCDIVIAATSARFGQPEIKLGLMPGMGGTQRLARLVGRTKAMDLILTGRTMEADEAERCGLVSRVVADAELVDTALDAATTVAGYSRHTVAVARETVARAEELSQAEGVRYERRGYYALFDTVDAREGMAAFVAKRPPEFNAGERGNQGDPGGDGQG